MIPDILTDDRDFISSKNGYTLRVIYQLATQKHELLYTYKGATNTLFSGTEEECYDKLWQVVHSIDRLTPLTKCPNKITMGPPLPDGFSVIPPEVDADSEERKRKRIKRLKAENAELREKLDIVTKEAQLDSDAITSAIANMDTSNPTLVPQLSFINEDTYKYGKRESMMDVAKESFYEGRLRIDKDMNNVFVFLRTLRDNLDGWEFLRLELDGTLHELDFSAGYMGGAGSEYGNITFYRTTKLSLKEGDILYINPVGQNARLDVAQVTMWQSTADYYQKLREKEQELRDTGDELALVKEHVEVLQAVNNTVNEEREELQRKYDATVKELEGKVEQAKKAAAYVRKLHEEGGERVEIIVEKVKKEKAELNSEIAKLTEQVEEKDAKIEKLTKDRDAVQAYADAGRRDASNARLRHEKEVFEKDKHIFALRTDIVNHQAEVMENFKSSVDELKKRVEVLEGNSAYADEADED